MKDSVEYFTEYVTKAILLNRKSYSEDFSVVEWEDGGVFFRDTLGREYIDCLGGYGVYLLGHRHPKVKNSLWMRSRLEWGVLESYLLWITSGLLRIL